VVVNDDRNLARSAAALTAAFVLTLAACGGGDDDDGSVADTAAGTAATAAAAGEPVVEIAGFAFGGVTSVPAGTVLTVVNNDSAPHTFTADDGSFDSGAIQPGASFEITLSTAGTVAFHCEFHSSMTGSITVT
jgi:plastocyanin